MLHSYIFPLVNMQYMQSIYQYIVILCYHKMNMALKRARMALKRFTYSDNDIALPNMLESILGDIVTFNIFFCNF